MDQDKVNEFRKQLKANKKELKPEAFDKPEVPKQKMKLTFTVYYEADANHYDKDVDVSNEWLLAQAERERFIYGDLSLDDLHEDGRDPVISIEPFRGTWV